MHALRRLPLNTPSQLELWLTLWQGSLKDMNTLSSCNVNRTFVQCYLVCIALETSLFMDRILKCFVGRSNSVFQVLTLAY